MLSSSSLMAEWKLPQAHLPHAVAPQLHGLRVASALLASNLCHHVANLHTFASLASKVHTAVFAPRSLQ